ncbi:MAG: malic enzyme-like NAD(P)-binding protein [Bacteroidota bacterium]
MDTPANSKQAALHYHQQAPAGKLSVQPTKPLESQKDLALAYSPGVAAPCKAIVEDHRKVFDYTAKGNLVAVISNGTAVLGLGNIGPEAAKPVMEGKAILLKKLAGIDAFDIELAATDPAEVIQIVKALAPTFGGINLEDIKAPECFQIEEALKAQLPMPIMHDDQHGTAIISSAALLNALEITNKNIAHIQLVVNGAGAGAIACTQLYLALGVKRENIIMCDSKGVVRKDRTDLNAHKRAFATERPLYTLAEALQGADVFLGLSAANLVAPAHLKSMAKYPIVFALANPDPEIAYDLAMATRNDLIMATGRSDYPNQVNNVLGFPYIFRGALDVRSTAINEAMKLAAVEAIAALAKEPVPEVIEVAYGNKPLAFGKDYLLPKPMDQRLITTVSTAVAKAAMESGVAQAPIKDWGRYRTELEQRIC